MHQFLGAAVTAWWLLATGGNSFAQTSGDTEPVRAANQSYYADVDLGWRMPHGCDATFAGC
jgi:hypothetical protein